MMELRTCHTGTAILLLANILGVSLASYEHTCSIFSRPHRYGLCGTLLADTVSLLCRSFSRLLVKREKRSEVGEKLKDILLNKEEAMSFLTKRDAHGSITCECCFNSCTYTELLQYCEYPVYNTRTSATYRNTQKRK